MSARSFEFTSSLLSIDYTVMRWGKSRKAEKKRSTTNKYVKCSDHHPSSERIEPERSRAQNTAEASVQEVSVRDHT